MHAAEQQCHHGARGVHIWHCGRGGRQPKGPRVICYRVVYRRLRWRSGEGGRCADAVPRANRRPELRQTAEFASSAVASGRTDAAAADAHAARLALPLALRLRTVGAAPALVARARGLGTSAMA